MSVGCLLSAPVCLFLVGLFVVILVHRLVCCYLLFCVSSSVTLCLDSSSVVVFCSVKLFIPVYALWLGHLGSILRQSVWPGGEFKCFPEGIQVCVSPPVGHHAFQYFKPWCSAFAGGAAVSRRPAAGHR